MPKWKSARWSRSAVGPLRTFVPALAKLCEIGTAGHSAPRMSPESGCARLSSLISLRRAPHRPDPMPVGCSRVEGLPTSRPGPPGARRSEIKGEPWAQPRAEDIRGGGYPVALAGAAHERAEANVRNGPRPAPPWTPPRFMRRRSREARQRTLNESGPVTRGASGACGRGRSALTCGATSGSRQSAPPWPRTRLAPRRSRCRSWRFSSRLRPASWLRRPWPRRGRGRGWPCRLAP